MTHDALPFDVLTYRPRVELPLDVDSSTFVVQRRVNIPLRAVQRGLADREPLTPSRRIELGAAGSTVVREPLRPIAPFSARQPLPTWCGPASLVSPRGGRVATVDIEVSMWSSESTCLTVRPLARNPQRWSRRRMRRYFELAHAAADAIGPALVARATAAANPTFEVDAYSDEWRMAQSASR